MTNQYGPETTSLFREYEYKLHKLALSQNHLTFLCKARQHKVIPKGLIVNLPIKNDRTRKISQKASEALIRERINHHRFNKAKLSEKCEEIREFFREILKQEDFVRIEAATQRSYEKVKQLTKESQIMKLNDLLSRKPVNAKPKEIKAVINISNRQLSPSEELVLNKGLNFEVAPKQIYCLNIVSAIEEAAHRLSSEDAEEYRRETRNVLDRKIKKTKSNLSREEIVALKKLRNDNNIKILPADKGNATVIMDTEQYEEKLKQTLAGGSYSKLAKDPTPTIERCIYKVLFKYKDSLDDRMRSKLTPHYSKPPHFYGLPKVHKPNVPLRPIVSSRDSPCHALARFLLKIISPLQGNTASFVKNTSQLMEKIRNLHLDPDDLMVSFDVVSLFTNVPVEDALTIIRRKLSEDNTLPERTDLSVDAVMELLTVCIKTTYFQIKDEFFQQEFGMAMGSPLSPCVSNIYMEDFENKAIETHQHKPNLWLRYVDDTFIIWKHGRDHLDRFLDHINSITESIKFTMEIEENNQLPFLDVLVKRCDNQTLKTQVYRKATHTGRYLNFTSNHHPNVLVGVAKCLYDRAKIICSTEDILQEEQKLISDMLRSNGYPDKIIQKASKERQPRQPTEENLSICVIPYMKGISEQLKRIGKKYKIRTAFKTINTLRSLLTHTKPKNKIQDSKNCIYKIPCVCGKKYIGETKRPLDVRVKEHKKLVREMQITKSKLAEHAFNEDHQIKWDHADIIEHEENTFKRKLKEAVHMMFLGQELVISSPSIDVPNIWKPLLKN